MSEEEEEEEEEEEKEEEGEEEENPQRVENENLKPTHFRILSSQKPQTVDSCSHRFVWRKRKQK